MYEKKRDRQGQLERDKANTLENERNRRGQLKRDAASAALEVLKYAKERGKAIQEIKKE